MSKFSLFMKGNKVARKNERYAPTSTLLDEKGVPLEWELRPLTTKENEALRDSCTIEVQVTGKPNIYRPKLNTSQYLAKMIVASTVFPDLYDKELQDSYGVMTPEDLLYAMVDNPGEFQEFTVWVQKYHGFTKTFEEKVDEAKN